MSLSEEKESSNHLSTEVPSRDGHGPVGRFQLLLDLVLPLGHHDVPSLEVLLYGLVPQPVPNGRLSNDVSTQKD